MEKLFTFSINYNNLSELFVSLIKLNLQNKDLL